MVDRFQHMLIRTAHSSKTKGFSPLIKQNVQTRILSQCFRFLLQNNLRIKWGQWGAGPIISWMLVHRWCDGLSHSSEMLSDHSLQLVVIRCMFLYHMSESHDCSSWWRLVSGSYSGQLIDLNGMGWILSEHVTVKTGILRPDFYSLEHLRDVRYHTHFVFPEAKSHLRNAGVDVLSLYEAVVSECPLNLPFPSYTTRTGVVREFFTTAKWGRNHIFLPIALFVTSCNSSSRTCLKTPLSNCSRICWQ